jgi:cell fate regulator YaaT (PSP1 superfamily)
MGCSCGSTKNGAVSGCQNNGACNTGGCNKMNVFDWLSNMEMPREDKFNIAEVRFKNGRKEFFSNPEQLNLTTGDAVVVEVPSGHHIGYVSLQGELVRLQMQKKKISIDGDIKKIYRIAHQKDLDKFEEVKKREMPTLYRTREIIRDLKLEMKLSDIEYQADNAKATFFYSADDRVDFRELIKLLAGEFRIRVEMRQISLRQEAGRLGGIGVCGRELCCATWLTDFKNVATSAARYQNLSLNPSKLSGQCGRLKCCLNYELETYMEALEHIPKIEGPLLTDKGEATLQKTDIFRKIMWFGFVAENTWYPLNIDRVNQILVMNREGRKPASLDADVVAEKIPVETLNSDLARMDQKFKGKSKKKSKKKRGPGEGQANANASNQQRSQTPQGQPREGQPRGERPPRGENQGNRGDGNRGENRENRGENRGEGQQQRGPRGERRGDSRGNEGGRPRGERRNQPQGNQAQGNQPQGSQPPGNQGQGQGGEQGGQPQGGGQQQGNQGKGNQPRNQGNQGQNRNNPGNKGSNQNRGGGPRPERGERSNERGNGERGERGNDERGNAERGNAERSNPDRRNADRGNSPRGNSDEGNSDRGGNRNSKPDNQQ